MTVETARQAPVQDWGRLRTDLLAMIDGELDTSFTLLKGFLVALSNGMVDDSAEARREYYAIMLRQSERLERLVAEVTGISSRDRDGSLVAVRDVELADLVASTCAELAGETRRTIEVSGCDGRVVVGADPSKLRIVLEKLVANAIWCSPANSTVTVSVHRNDDRAMVMVADQGMGVSPAAPAGLLEPLGNSSGASRTEGGAGPALDVAGRLVEAMGGSLSFASKPGGGSTFLLSLPVSDPGEGSALSSNGASMEYAL